MEWINNLNNFEIYAIVACFLSFLSYFFLIKKYWYIDGEKVFDNANYKSWGDVITVYLLLAAPVVINHIIIFGITIGSIITILNNKDGNKNRKPPKWM